MPKPRPNEPKDEYIKRCIPFVLEEGTAKNRDQAVAVCNSIWSRHHKGEAAEENTDDDALQIFIQRLMERLNAE